jgi:alpha-1,4-digalacturonate transport system permease protein
MATAVAALLQNSDLLKSLLQTHILPDQYRVVNLYRSLTEPIPTLAGTTLSLSMVPGETRRLAQVGSPTGAQYIMVDPKDPATGEIAVLSYSTPLGPSTELKPVREVYFNYKNYTGAMEAFDFMIYLRNSVIVTIVATIITLIVNSMAAFALSKYAFAGREVVFLIIIATLMVPISVIMIPAFLVISRVGWVNNLWGLIIPGAATPTGVFLLRQYMLTIPDELLDSARIDGASEWRIYWQIILPLARPAMAVLAIFSIMWRWNDFLWPLIVVSRNELFTLQVGLNAFQGGLDVQWNYILAMTVLTLLPITLVFAFLQRFITSGIATTGMKG